MLTTVYAYDFIHRKELISKFITDNDKFWNLPLSLIKEFIKLGYLTLDTPLYDQGLSLLTIKDLVEFLGKWKQYPIKCFGYLTKDNPGIVIEGIIPSFINDSSKYKKGQSITSSILRNAIAGFVES